MAKKAAKKATKKTAKKATKKVAKKATKKAAKKATKKAAYQFLTTRTPEATLVFFFAQNRSQSVFHETIKKPKFITSAFVFSKCVYEIRRSKLYQLHLLD